MRASAKERDNDIHFRTKTSRREYGRHRTAGGRAQNAAGSRRRNWVCGRAPAPLTSSARNDRGRGEVCGIRVGRNWHASSRRAVRGRRLGGTC